jgi:hypothetical protein
MYRNHGSGGKETGLNSKYQVGKWGFLPQEQDGRLIDQQFLRGNMRSNGDSG